MINSETTETKSFEYRPIDLALSLARSDSSEQAEFFNEFFKEMAKACEINGSNIDGQLIGISHAGNLEQISKEAFFSLNFFMRDESRPYMLSFEV